MLGAGFLERNGYEFHATEADAAASPMALVAEAITESAYPEWLTTNSKPA